MKLSSWSFLFVIYLLWANSNAQADEIWTGVIAPANRINFVSPVSGQIHAIHANIGQALKSDALVISIDPEHTHTQLKQQESNLISLQHQIEVAELELSNKEEELKRRVSVTDLVSEEDVSRAKTQVAQAKMELSIARGRYQDQLFEIEKTKTKLSKSSITMPFSGFISYLYKNKGSQVGEGESLLQISSSEKVIRFAVSAADVARLQLQSPVSFLLEDRTYRGRVSAISQEIDLASNSFFIEAIPVSSLPPIGTSVLVSVDTDSNGMSRDG